MLAISPAVHTVLLSPFGWHQLFCPGVARMVCEPPNTHWDLCASPGAVLCAQSATAGLQAGLAGALQPSSLLLR